MQEEDEGARTEGSGLVVSLGEGELSLYRRVGGKLEFWRTIRGDAETLNRALASARELDSIASDLGGWSNALRFGLYPAKPVHPTRVSSGVFLQHELNGRFRKL